jgi:hypothetical protein
MKTYNSGETVKGGFYWSPRRRRFEVVQSASGVLPGEAGTSFVRVPVLLVIPLALAMSVVFVLFLPVVGFAVLAESDYVRARVVVPRWLRRAAARPAVVSK